MKLFVKLMMLIVVLALAGPFFIKGPDGQPLMEIGNVTASIKRQWNKLVVDSGRAVGHKDAGKVEVHRWQDADGNWHFSDEANPEGNSELIKVDPYASRMDAFKPHNINSTSNAPASGSDASGIKVPSPLTVSPGEAKQLVEDTAKVRDDLEKRAQDMEEKSRQQ